MKCTHISIQIERNPTQDKKKQEDDPYIRLPGSSMGLNVLTLLLYSFDWVLVPKHKIFLDIVENEETLLYMIRYIKCQICTEFVKGKQVKINTLQLLKSLSVIF